LIEVNRDSPDFANYDGVQALPSREDYGEDWSLSADVRAEGFEPFVRLTNPESTRSVIRSAAAASAHVGIDGDLFARELEAFVDANGVVAAQWANTEDKVMTTIIELSDGLPMADRDLVHLLTALERQQTSASSAVYQIDYRRLLKDTALENRATGITTTGDQGEAQTIEVRTNLTDRGHALTVDWTMTTDGIDNGALSHVEHRYLSGTVFVRAACSADELAAASTWRESPVSGFESLDTPAYVPALLERMVDPSVVESAEGQTRIEFSLRRFGLLGQPWPLWSYDDDWDIEGSLVLTELGVPLSLTIHSTRPTIERGGPGEDIVEISFLSWNEELSISAPDQVTTSRPHPPACPTR
jgi:hypothetical protein